MSQSLKMRRSMGKIAVTGFVMVTMSWTAHAQQPVETPWVDTAQSRIRLVAGNDPSQQGVRVILVEMQLQPSWKTYWRMPGDAGIPPSFDWAGSENLGPVEVRYAAPSIFIDQGGTTIGYKTAVTFPVYARPPDAEAPTRVKVELAFGICREVCIPVEAKLSLDIPPAAVVPKETLAALNAKVPVRKTLVDAGRGLPAVSAITFEGGASAPRLKIKTNGVTDLFLEGPAGLYVPLPRRSAGPEEAATFEVDLKKTQDLPDLKGKTLTVTAVGKSGAIETTWTMPSQF